MGNELLQELPEDLKRIIGESKIIVLIDEIFQGTNSHERHIGAQKVIQSLSKQGAMGLVFTHDLELGRIAQVNRSIETIISKSSTIMTVLSSTINHFLVSPGLQTPSF